MIEPMKFKELPTVPLDLTKVDMNRLLEIDSLLASEYTATEARLALWAHQEKTEFVENHKDYLYYKKEVLARRAHIHLERAPVRAELRRRAGIKGGKTPIYPFLRNFARSVELWDGCPTPVRLAAMALAEAMSSVLDAEKPSDDFPTWNAKEPA